MIDLRIAKLTAAGLGFNSKDPIVVTHSPEWKKMYSDEVDFLMSHLNIKNLKFFHIGSTSVEHLYAKPILDIMGVTPDFDEIDSKAKDFESAGYVVKGEYGIVHRRYFVLSHSMTRETLVHLHIFLEKSVNVHRHLAFRDFLRLNQNMRDKYSNLKMNIMGDPQKRMSYQVSKNELVTVIEEMSLLMFPISKESPCD